MTMSIGEARRASLERQLEPLVTRDGRNRRDRHGHCA